MKTRRLWSSLALSLAIGCAGAHPGAGGTVGPRPGPEAIARIRTRAESRPDDAAAQRTLVEWELFGAGGEPARAEAALARASALDGQDLGLVYERAILAEAHGKPDEALDAYLAVLSGVGTSHDPRAPWIAESTIAALANVQEDAARFVERVRPVLERLSAEPGRIGAPSRRQLWLWLRDLALERGDVATVDAMERAVACPRSGRVAGPFGPAVLAPFDTRLPAEGPGPLADRYDLGPGRGLTDTHTTQGRFCTLALGEGSRGGPGTRVLEASFHVDRDGPYVLAVGSEASLEIRVDDVSVARVDRRGLVRSAASFHPIALTAGDHLVEIKVASRESNPTVEWMVLPVADGVDPTVGIEVPPASGPLDHYLAVDILSLRGETLEARERMLGVDLESAPAALLSLVSRVVRDDPYRPGTESDDERRRIATLATRNDPASVWAALLEAQLGTHESERLAALRSVAERFPDLVSIELLLADELEEAGFSASAEQVVGRAYEARPDSCPVVRARYGQLVERGRIEAAGALTEALVRCDAQSQARLDLALHRREWATARGELERLRPMLDEGAARSIELRIARGSGDADAERRLVASIEADGEPGEFLVPSVDRRYASADRAGALALVVEESAREPRYASDLRRLGFALSGQDVMGPYRADGLAVIRRFEESGRHYGGRPAILVFDYMVTRVFEDGSSVDLIHQIHRLETAEGVDEFDTLSLGGRILTVRAVSADGTVREPDAIRDGSIPMPPLEVGDYVEYEYVLDHAPKYGDGFLSGGWTFQSAVQPFDHSEMVFVAPESMALEFDVRGPVPAPTVTVAGGLRTTRYLMTQVPALTAEPNSVSEPPVQPTLRAGVRVTWSAMFDAVRDRLLDLEPVDPAAVRLVRAEILGGTMPAKAERARRIHRWVMENVEPAEDSFFASAPAMLAARAGQRLRLLRYLLGLADVSTRIAFVRHLGSQPPHPSVPRDSDYAAMVLLVDVDAPAPLVMVGAGRGYAYDYFPAVLRGQEGIVLESGLPRVVLPAAQGTADSERFEGEIELDARGRAVLHLVVATTGENAAGIRGALRQIPAAERNRVLAERLVPSMIPGGIGDPDSIRIGGADDWEAPLTIEFVAASAGLVRSGRGGLYLVPVFASGIDRTFASLPGRTTSELVGELDATLSLRIRGPGVADVPQAVSLDDPSGASAVLRASRESDGSVRFERHIRVPAAVIRPEAYDRFARFCRATAQMEERTVVFSPR